MGARIKSEAVWLSRGEGGKERERRWGGDREGRGLGRERAGKGNGWGGGKGGKK